MRYEGRITIGGIPNKDPEAKRLLGYVPEIPAVYDLLTVSEHLEFVRRAWRLEDDGTAAALLERLELGRQGRETGQGTLQGHAAKALHRLRPGPQAQGGHL